MLMIEEMIKGIRNYIDKVNLARYLTAMISQHLFTSFAGIWLWDKNNHHFTLISQQGLTFPNNFLPSEGTVGHWFLHHDSNILTTDKILEEECPELRDRLLSEWMEISASLCLALRSDSNQTSGLLILGPKVNKEDYSDQEIDILLKITQQAALTIDQIEIYTQMVEEHIYANLGRMATQIAHDLGSPLSNISVFLQLLEQDSGWKHFVRQELSQKFFPIARKEVERATGIIKNLLLYAQPIRLQTERIALHKLLDQVLLLVAERIDKAAVKVVKKYYPEEIIIPGETGQLTRIFLNLIENAIESMENEEIRELHLQVDKDPPVIKVQVIDTGKGIPDQIRQSLFSPFVTFGKKGGLGLGLSIVKQLSGLYGGRVEVKTTSAKGTCFVITIPLEKRESSRKPVDSLEVYRMPQNELFLARDISAGGLRVSCEGYIPVNQLLKIFIKLPDHSSLIPALSKVVWIKQKSSHQQAAYELGLEFVDIGQENQECIKQWIELT